MRTITVYDEGEKLREPAQFNVIVRNNLENPPVIGQCELVYSGGIRSKRRTDRR